MSEPVIRVRGEASSQCSPDLATLTVTLHRTGESAEVVRSELATASVQLAALLEPAQPALESMSTGGLHVSPVYDELTSARVTGYRGSYSLSLVVSDFDALSPLVVAAATLPGVQVDGPWWSLRPGNSLYRQVRLDAIADARRRAEDYAAAFAATVVDVVEIADEEAGGGIGFARSSVMERGGQGEPVGLDFQPALQTVTGQVTVRFIMSRPVFGTTP